MRWFFLAGLVSMLTGCRAEKPSAAVKSLECTGCHRAQVEALASSHHAKGQGVARGDSVPPGEVGSMRVHADAGTLFFSWLEADGGRAVGPVKYTIGYDPLIQLAVELESGLIQVPPIGYAADAGGWRAVTGTVGDWREPAFNWNGSCAPCHATEFRVGAGQGHAKTFTSSWTALNVTCEACHGPAQKHLDWLTSGRPVGVNGGYEQSLARRNVFTIIPDGGPIAHAIGEVAPDTQTETCAACHSRRRPLTDDGATGGHFLDRFEPGLMSPGLYSASGLAQDEVYEAFSFSMSRMNQAGVRCTHCHDPHSGSVKARGNALCAQCHDASTFDTPQHAVGTNECVTCHMPSSTFLGIDVRHDHSLPRSRSARSAASDAFAAAFEERPDAAARLSTVAADPTVSSFQRASALALLRSAKWSSPEVTQTITAALHSPDAWLRYGATSALMAAPQILRANVSNTYEPARAVRVQTRRALTGLGPRAGDDERMVAEMANAFRGDAWLAVASTAEEDEDLVAAERALRTGLARDPTFVPLTINLADLLRKTGRDAKGIELLEALLPREADGPWAADLAYALGLAHWRNNDKDRALTDFRTAAAKDGSVVHLLSWVLAERAQRGPKAGLVALEKARMLRPGQSVWAQVATDWQAERR